ncbi:MAG: class I tRNA ligase family protein, partial [Candidatus Sungiibacteriota bacterium]
MSTELSPQYDPKQIEDTIYAMWEESGFFNPDRLPPIGADKRGLNKRRQARTKPFTIIMPPPNANGSLHIGHAVFVTLQDIMIRYKRMAGFKTLWLPGADHAGFETQVVYDKKLEKEGRNRFAIPREQLYQEMLAFTLENKKIMEGQLRKLGASCDWSREKFTLDPDIVQKTQDAFVDFYNRGLVYRGERVVNWCVKHQTALADLETSYIEKKDPLYYFQYGPFVIATARPETKFGDKYVVMHPKDKRYAKYKDGQKIDVEWINGPITATIIKDDAIDMAFGTGAMTITPWHDPIDFEIAERHGLQKEQVIDRVGKLLPIAGEFSGMKIADARPLIAEKLKAKGLLVKIEEGYDHKIAVCYKCKHPIEPQILPQWFLKMKPLAAAAIKAVENGKIAFVPPRFKKTYFQWLRNIRDWNLSQQITWGIR